MPTYIATLHECENPPGPETFEAPSIEAARSTAIIYLGSFLRDFDGRFWTDCAQLRLDLSDANGLMLYQVSVMGTVAPAVGSPRANVGSPGSII